MHIHSTIRKLKAHEKSARAIGNIAEADAFAAKIRELEAKAPTEKTKTPLDLMGGLIADLQRMIYRREVEIANIQAIQAERAKTNKAYRQYIAARWVMLNVPSIDWPRRKVIERKPFNNDTLDKLGLIGLCDVLECGHKLQTGMHQASLRYCPYCWAVANPDKLPKQP